MQNHYWHEFFGYTPADRFLTRTKLVEMKHPPHFVTNRRKWDPLTMSIWKKFQLAQQTRQIYKTKMRLWRFIYEVTMVSIQYRVHCIIACRSLVCYYWHINSCGLSTLPSPPTECLSTLWLVSGGLFYFIVWVQVLRHGYLYAGLHKSEH